MPHFKALTCSVACANAFGEAVTSGFRVLLSLADGTSAAAHKRDFGTSRWQLSNEITPLCGMRKRGVREVCAASADSPISTLRAADDARAIRSIGTMTPLGHALLFVGGGRRCRVGVAIAVDVVVGVAQQYRAGDTAP
jgi:hypothetical protein